ncbi:MAG: glycine--tRNA ligase subunit beta, partial [Leptolyngbyaceae bacterium]|nr:glycine--tRNA ligase subunit beta [Leptolyngbyaceae bacterium]
MNQEALTFLLEVGTEELPASFVGDGIQQWEQRIPQSLSDRHLTPESIEIYGTPRRLAVLIRGLPAQQPDQTEEVKGPPAQAAFKEGKPTPAAVGFANKQGVALEALEIRATDKGDFVFAQKTTLGQSTAVVLTELIPTWITGLEGKRFMRWGDGDLRFPRPIRWLVALLNDAVLPITLQNGSSVLQSDRLSQGHRVLHPEPITIPHANTYVAALSTAYVEVRSHQRRHIIQTQVEQAAEQVGGWAEVYSDLLTEVTNLVESPSIVVGKFDPEFLELPPEVIITEMVSHQRYFPVRSSSQSSNLLPYFMTVSNGDPAKADIIAAGNERVIRARLSDGKFFYDADRAIPLEDYL